MTYLVDTNVISALGPAQRTRHQALVDWLDRSSDRLFISVITVTEIRDGIAKATREGATRKAADLTGWWDAVEHLYASRILAFDLRAAAIAGTLMDQARAAGVSSGFADAAIAATAKAHDLVVLTRNKRDFAAYGLPTIDPFTTPPL